MELAAVSFENYKSFKERVELDLGQITYLIGPNGAGKSNVFAGINFISAMVQKEDRPSLDDCFDGMQDAATTFSFTVKLSEDERRRLGKDRGYSEIMTPNNSALKLLKHEVSFQNNQQIRQKLLLSDAGGTLRLVQDLHIDDDVYKLDDRVGGGMGLKAEYALKLNQEDLAALPIRDFITAFDQSLYRLMTDLFSSLRLVGERKKFPGSASVSQDDDVSSDGDNLPNQLMTVFNDRSQIQKFSSKLNRLSSGAIDGIDSKLQGTKAVIELQEKWRKSTTDPSEISSGHHQQVILLSFFGSVQRTARHDRGARATPARIGSKKPDRFHT